MRSVFVFFDLETTSLNTGSAEILEIGAVCESDEEETFQTYVLPNNEISQGATRVNGLRLEGRHLYYHDKRVNARTPRNGLAAFLNFLRQLKDDYRQKIILVAHNGNRFDFPILRRSFEENEFKAREISEIIEGYCDSLDSFREFREDFQARNQSHESLKLPDLISSYNINNGTPHKALDDSKDLMNVCIQASSKISFPLERFLMAGLCS